MRAPKFIQVGKLGRPSVSFLKFRMLDVRTSSETLIFTEKTYRTKNNRTCENAVARIHGSWMLRVMGS